MVSPKLSIDELKDLIIFAKTNKVKSLKIGEFTVEISEIAHITDHGEIDMGQSKNKAVVASMSELVGDSQLTAEEEEDLLFHSARP